MNIVSPSQERLLFQNVKRLHNQNANLFTWCGKIVLEISKQTIRSPLFIIVFELYQSLHSIERHSHYHFIEIGIQFKPTVVPTLHTHLIERKFLENRNSVKWRLMRTIESFRWWFSNEHFCFATLAFSHQFECSRIPKTT